MTLRVHTQTTFSQEIERIVRENKITYFEAVCDYMALNNIEPETVPRLLNITIKKKIEAEATDLNLLNRGKRPAKLLL
jgi:Phage late-transcription coactivator